MLKKKFKNGILFSLITLATIVYTNKLEASSRNSYAYNKHYSSKSYKAKSFKTKSYSKKAPYSGYAKRSKVNGLPKTKITSGYVKRTSKGYSYVYPYARSK